MRLGALQSDGTRLAMADCDGDIAAIPEPEIYAPTLAGLAAFSNEV
jgi:hypothetical protein